MKTALGISLLLNAVMLAAAVFVCLAPKPRRAPAAAALPTPLQAGAPAGRSPGPTPVTQRPSAEPAPFRWSQLTSSDYPVYVKNLRSIGCPEATVRAVVTADVQAKYLARAKEIERRLTDLDHGSWQEQLAEAQTASALRDELSRLGDEAVAEINELLGLAASPSLAANGGAPTSENADPSGVPKNQPVVAPLVFHDVDLAAMDLSADQKQAIANIRADFLQQIGGTNQDPNDPAYLERWQKAQPDADSQLQTDLGIEAYLDYQIQANQQTLAKQAAQARH